MANTLLEMKNIVKLFPGVRALDNVNLQVEEGEIHALVGENGAGKSTLMNVLSGIYPYGSYEGEIVYQGQRCEFHKIKDSESRGIVIIHQELALVPYLTIGENMFLGNERGKKARIDWDETYNKADELLRMVGLNESSRTLIKDIGVGKQQLVEIAKALAKNVKLLILDEPTASLNETDSQKLLDLMLEFKSQGMTCIIISHKLNEISYVADAITVIRDGKTIETLYKDTDDFSEERIIKSMVGRELTNRYPKREDCPIGDTIFEVKNWSVYHPDDGNRQVLKNINISVRAGEVVGLAGLMGAGRTELAMSLFGHAYGQKISGEVYMKGKKVEMRSVRAAIDNNLAYVSEDRKTYGLVLIDSITFNMSLAALRRFFSERGVVDERKEAVKAEEYRRLINVKTATMEQPVGSLSGGNQQKVVLAKWMLTQPDVLILDEPTRGIDVGAKYEIYSVINDLAKSGKAIIIISSEMPEIIGTCDRTYVINEGAIAGELVGSAMTQEAIMGCIMAHNRKGE